MDVNLDIGENIPVFKISQDTFENVWGWPNFAPIAAICKNFHWLQMITKVARKYQRDS